MSSDLSTSEFITQQEERELEADAIAESLANKMKSIEQTVTITDIGDYLHPIVCLRDETSRFEASPEYTRFEYDKREFPVVSARVSLLAFVLDSENDYTTDDHSEWLSNDGIPEDVYDEYCNWMKETDAPLNYIYHNTSKAIWNVTEERKYSQGILSPTPTLSILFEDDAGVIYCGLLPVTGNEETVQELFESILDREEVEVESIEEDDSEGDEENSNENSDKTDVDETKTVYKTTETEGSISEFTLQIQDLEIEFEVIIPVTWYSYPMVEAARTDISANAYESLTAYDSETGWYEFSVDMLTENINSRHSVTLTTPYDYTSLNWSASLGETAPLRQILSPQDADAEEATVYCRLFTSTTPKNRTNDIITTSRTATWVVRPDTPTTNSETENTVEDQTRSQDATDTESSGNKVPSKGLLSRILNRE